MRILIFLSFILFFPFSNLLGQEGTIAGKAIDRENGEPLAGVNVMVSPAEAESGFNAAVTTRDNGIFTIDNVPPGMYTLAASHVGYKTHRQKVQVEQEKVDVSIKMEEMLIDLGEIVVSSLYQNKRVKNVSMPLEVMTDNKAEHLVGFSPSEFLENQPGITVRDDGVWATSINIRGLNEQRLVALIDGNRIETATDLAASLSLVDMSELERVEVIKGTSSSLYGTGAMGGIVNFISKRGSFTDEPYVVGALETEFQTVNELYGQKFAAEGGNDFAHFRIGGKIRKASNLKTPQGVLPNSQFEDHNISLNVGLKTFENQTLLVQFQRFSANDVGLPGGDPFPSSAKATYTNADRNLTSIEYKITDILPELSEMSIKYFHQYILRDVLLEPNVTQTNKNMRITPEQTLPSGKHNTNGLQLKTNWSFKSNYNIIGGIDFWQRKLTTKREKYITQEILDDAGEPTDTVNLVVGEIPIPDSKFGSAGVFLQNEFYTLDNNLKISIGGRYDFIRVHNEHTVDPEFFIRDEEPVEPPPKQVVTFEEQTVHNTSWSTDIGMLYHLTENTDLTLNAGRSFRSPSIEERYKYIDLGNMIRLGDPELKPENGYSYDLGVRIWSQNFQFKANGFLNQFSNLVVEKPGTYIKKYETGGADTLPALINSNVDKARIYGFDLQFVYNVHNNIMIHGNTSFVRGMDKKNNTNLPLIPPLNGRLGVEYRLENLGSADLTAIMFDRQDKIADNEEKTEGYVLFDLNLASEGINLNYAKLKIFTGVKNILDESYRNHLSSNRGLLDLQPGRNIYIKAQLKF
ncbi:MAG: TonB-dependent receptor [Bacteroidales bacterium]